MYVKIYFGDKPVFLCDRIEESLHEYMHHPDTIFMEGASGPVIKSLLHEIAKTGFHAGILLHPSLDALKKAFWKHFAVIKAGGGLVANEAGEVLVMFRRGKWDLPKGKLDPGETIEQCAVREVREETGLVSVALGPFLCTTYHTFNDYGHAVLKESYWYQMTASASEVLKPQVSEDIHELRWVAPPLPASYLSNTYSSVRDVLAKV